MKKLDNVWFHINPKNIISNISGKKILVYLAKNDEVIPFANGMQLVKALKKKNEVIVKINSNHNHFLSGLLNLIRWNQYIRFLKN